MSRLRLSDDEGLLRREPSLDLVWPRQDKAGNRLRSWDTQHSLAVEELERRLRSRRSTGEPFEIGRLGLRGKERLRACAEMLALHFIFVCADTMGDTNGFLARKAAYYWEQAGNALDAEAAQLDYDEDRSGAIDDAEKNQPHPPAFIRG
jgi:hypothetical protein